MLFDAIKCNNLHLFFYCVRLIFIRVYLACNDGHSASAFANCESCRSTYKSNYQINSDSKEIKRKKESDITKRYCRIKVPA